MSLADRSLDSDGNCVRGLAGAVGLGRLPFMYRFRMCREKAKSKPLLSRAGLGRGWRLVGGWPRPAPRW